MKITVNNREHEVPGRTISYNELLFVAGIDPAIPREVKYKATTEGELKPGESMELVGNVSFNVTPKNKL